MQFYSIGLPKCRCGRPASYRILGTGNVPYDHVCERHLVPRIRELARAHAPERPTSPQPKER